MGSDAGLHGDAGQAVGDGVASRNPVTQITAVDTAAAPHAFSGPRATDTAKTAAIHVK